MALRQQQPVVTCVLDQPSAGFHQSLLQAGKRPGGDPHRQHQPPAQIPEVVGDQTQPQPHLVGAKAVTGKPRQLHRLLALFNPLFRRAALVVERTTARLSAARLVTMKPTRGNNSPKWNSTFATTRRAVFQVAASYRKLLYRTTGLWLGLPTGR